MSEIKLTADSGGGTTSIKAPSTTTSNADVVLKLPVADGSSGQVIKTDGSGQLSFTSNAGTTINNNADNRVITGSGTANTLEGEANLTFDGDTAAITRSGNSAGGLSITNTNNTQGSAHARLELSGGDNASAIMRMECNGHANEFIADGSGNLRIDDNGTERMRIDSSGNVGIGTASPNSFSNYKVLTIQGGTSGSGIDLEKSDGNIYGRLFADADGLQIQSTQSGDSIRFETNGSNVRARITDDGLCFNTDTAGANALSDYEEGTWTPAFKASSASGNSSTTVNESKYTKIGQMVHVSCYITNTGHHSSGTGGTARITGLPFQNTGNHVAISVGYFSALTQNQVFVTGTVQPGTSEVLLRHLTGANTSSSNMDYSNAIGTSTELIFEATYETAS